MKTIWMTLSLNKQNIKLKRQEAKQAEMSSERIWEDQSVMY